MKMNLFDFLFPENPDKKRIRVFLNAFEKEAKEEAKNTEFNRMFSTEYTAYNTYTISFNGFELKLEETFDLNKVVQQTYTLRQLKNPENVVAKIQFFGVMQEFNDKMNAYKTAIKEINKQRVIQEFDKLFPGN